MKKLSILTLIVTLVIVIFFWNSNKPTQSLQLVENLQQECNEINYQFIQKSSDMIDKSITMRLQNSINNYNIARIDLLQDKKIVYENVPIDKDSTFDNKITVSMNEYVPCFNNIKLHTDKGVTVIDVGQFYFDEINVNSEDISRSLNMIKSSSRIKNNTYTADLKFEKEDNYNPMERNLIVLIPKSFSETGVEEYLEKISEDEETIVYKYTCTIPQQLSNDFSNTSFEVMISEEIEGDIYPKFVFYVESSTIN